MPPILVDPHWYERHWYGGGKLRYPTPPALLSWIGAAASLLLSVVVLSSSS